jgi:50S ribosomal subunit-associated GTPase HflX
LTAIFRRRNSETGKQLTGKSCLDRQELFEDFFDARTDSEARLQIELAELKHSLPRLAHKYSILNRQRGGRYGTKGSGEKKLELDRRTVQNRIDRLKEEIKKVEETEKRRESAVRRYRFQLQPLSAIRTRESHLFSMPLPMPIPLLRTSFSQLLTNNAPDGTF